MYSLPGAGDFKGIEGDEIMTPKQRAKKIQHIVGTHQCQDGSINWDLTTNPIAAQIHEAVEEQKKFGMSITRIQVAKAYEECAKIAENYVPPLGRTMDLRDNHSLAERIRTRAKEIK